MEGAKDQRGRDQASICPGVLCMLPPVDAVVDSGAHAKLGRCFGQASWRVQDIGNDWSDGWIWMVYLLPTAVCLHWAGYDEIALSLIQFVGTMNNVEESTHELAFLVTLQISLAS